MAGCPTLLLPFFVKSYFIHINKLGLIIDVSDISGVDFMHNIVVNNSCTAALLYFVTLCFY